MLKEHGEKRMTREEVRDASLVRAGFEYALSEYGIYKDGCKTIGCTETPIKEILERFDKEKTAYDIARIMELARTI